MSRRRKSPSTASKKLKVGDRVRFKRVQDEVTGTIVEDRGPLGFGGRQIFAVRALMDIGLEQVIELPAELLERA